ncbi:Hypothetical protein IALB_1028 [Ignavibacterium album JCM 16511]|uniref:Uncharacterized protein n=1 Tax=Ignavibacterium album (strain DSM 19864 / JCM 16511 / NBRC 101810 / Mat9-16) TaxID=945713 RepID=I0AID2_IGNAJ|nr:hypothetical protein [Ignavibacterium album]AFH48739.1 Hypothetical protein IALB_1028 [Ignavibacterium album JCM 16511]
MKILLFVFISLIFIQCSSEIYKKDDFYSQATLKTEREKFYSTAIYETINQSLSLPLTDSTESKYTSAFWAMELLQFRNEVTDKAISNSLTDFQNRSITFQRALMEIIFTLYQSEFVNEIKSLLPQINNSKIFAMCIHYLKEAEDLEHLKRYSKIFESKFMRPVEDPIIKMLNYDLNTKFRHKLNTPPLIDLLKKNFSSDKIVIYSFQRLNRDYPGLVVIKKPDGKFLRDESGEIFSVPQLARAITELPGYITNGNTPEGILSIQGTDVSKNTFIGPSPNLQLVIPFEVTPEIYFHKSIDDSVWYFDLYKNLLPESWQDYLPIYESFYAGKAGRNEIIAHGTTIAPQFYNDKSYYPFTPSLGCLTTKEIWSEETGRLVESDQLKFMNSLLQFSELKGYLIVVNIDNKHSPVELREIKDLILMAEN